MVKPTPVLLASVAAAAALAGCRSDGDGPPPGAITPDSFLTTEVVPTEQATEPIHRQMDQALDAAAQDEAGIDVLPDAEPEAAPEGAGEPGPGSRPDAAAPDRGSAAPAQRPGATAGPTSGAGEAYPIAGMVGQVNGRAIYADDVLGLVEEQLAALGSQLSVGEFRERAHQIISATLEQLVTDALILGEAQRNLSEREQQSLAVMIDRHRQDLIRRHGRGSLAVTERAIREQTGKTLDETLQDYRQQRLVQHYLQNQLLPRINVTRRDVERYYQEHADEFNPDAQRVLRLIRVSSESEAAQVQQQLESGVPFEEVAASDLNTYRPGTAGLMDPVVGPNAFSDEALNQAVVSLEEGQVAGPVAVGSGFMFVRLEAYQKPEAQPLRSVQLEIERRLKEAQYRRLSDEYRQRLFEEGSYNSLDQMADNLVAIAVSRYAGR